ncbi:MAG: type II toxin-antitoxin system RelB/DinJ family antitoxin [Candidatus Paceibacterota bacterium]|jgi:addiction module RelB/DinJ family antitoxin
MSKLIIEIDDSLLTEAKLILDSVGIDIDIAFNIFVKRIVKEKGLPFSLKQGSDIVERVSSVDNQEYLFSGQSNTGRSNSSITIHMIEEVWNVFKNYNKGFLEVNKLADSIFNKTGMNRGSAMIYLNILVNLCKGEINRRSMKPKDFEFFLMKIKHELGLEIYKNSIYSVRISIPYWKSNNSTFAENMDEILKKLEVK